MTEVNKIDAFAQLEADFKALKAKYEAAKEEILEECMAACGPNETKSKVYGNEVYADYSMTTMRNFSLDIAIEKGFITKEQIEQCKKGGSRNNLTMKVKPSLAMAA